MSQEKVDRYKKEKANRQAIMKKEKRMRVLSTTAVLAAIIALAVWFGISLYQKSQSAETYYYTTDYTAIENYVTDLSASS